MYHQRRAYNIQLFSVLSPESGLILLSTFESLYHLADDFLEERLSPSSSLLLDVAPYASLVVFQVSLAQRYGWVPLHVAEGGFFAANHVTNPLVCIGWAITVERAMSIDNVRIRFEYVGI